MTTGQADARLLLEQKLNELTQNNMEKLAGIERQVNEQLHLAVEKQMETSFQRVIDQFAAVQKAMGDVQAVTAQIGDLRRVFSNVKTRGGWGETQLKALLDDMLPAGAYEMNRKLREDSDEAVEFVVHMPMKGETRPVMAIDSKFPLEDYERLLDAAATGDAEAERQAKRGLEQRLRLEAKKISDKYIVPPITVEFAVLYLPTDGLFAEIARIPGLIEEIGRLHKVLISGPSLLPAMLRTIHLGFMTMALEQKTGEIRHLLGATRTEMGKMDAVLEKLAKKTGEMGNTIESARVRTRAVSRRLKGIEAVDAAETAVLFPPDEIIVIEDSAGDDEE
jgi:DNA recombination protein RmuC